jgi:hypothetical protein
MTEEPNANITETPGIVWTTSEGGVCEAFSDWFHVNWLPLTVRIRFGQIVTDPNKPPDKALWVIDERAALTMPWATVKSLNELLTKLVVAYEKTNGAIAVPTVPTVE